jgi:hypothetical protein
VDAGSETGFSLAVDKKRGGNTMAAYGSYSNKSDDIISSAKKYYSFGYNGLNNCDFVNNSRRICLQQRHIKDGLRPYVYTQYLRFLKAYLWDSF